MHGHCFLLTAEELKHADQYEVAEFTRIRSQTNDGKAFWIYAATSEVKPDTNSVETVLNAKS